MNNNNETKKASVTAVKRVRGGVAGRTGIKAGHLNGKGGDVTVEEVELAVEKLERG